MSRRFDSLVHVTPDGSWPNGRCDASWSRLITELDRGGVAHACLVGLPGMVSNDHVLECSRRSHGRLVPIAGVDPTQYHDRALLEGALDDIARAGFLGVKLHPRLNGYDPLDPRCLSAVGESSERGLVVFLDTLFRQPGRPVAHAADVVDQIVSANPDARVVLLHGGGAALLEVAEVVRSHAGLVLDLSFTLVRYANSSIDADIRWLMQTLDRRIVIGSDMPEITPFDAFARAEWMADGLAREKWDNISYGNLARLLRMEHAAD